MRVLITGATGGIGEALATRLNREGIDLLLQGRDQDKLNALTQRLDESRARVASIRADINSPLDRRRIVNMASSFSVDTLINNAGVNQFASFADTDIDRIIQTNVSSTLQLTQSMLPSLLTSIAPRIINLGSAFGSIGYPGYVAYCAAKHAIKGFSEALKREYSATALEVIYVSPRTTATDMNAEAANELNRVLGVGSDSAETVAKQILLAMRKNHSRVQLGFAEKIQTKLNGLLPSLVDQAVKKQLSTIKHYLNLEHINEISHHNSPVADCESVSHGDLGPGVAARLGDR
jgi:short-subunit dehydrogenase